MTSPDDDKPSELGPEEDTLPLAARGGPENWTLDDMTRAEGGASPEAKDPGADQAPATLGVYRLIREIGRGGQGVVYLAEDPRLRRNVALKVFQARWLSGDERALRFQREAEVASKLAHPGVCPIYDTGQDGRFAFIAMPYIQGATLATRIAAAQDGALHGHARLLDDATGSASDDDQKTTPTTPSAETTVWRVMALIEKVARGLAHAHQAGIIHRDIKPANIMVPASGDPVLMDFGLARDEDSELPTITQTGDVFGTPAYMAPEQLARDARPMDARTDIWALGVTLFECLTLRRPFEAPTREALYQQILQTEPPRARRLNPAIPADLQVVLDTALEKDLDRRYQTAGDLAEDLRRVAAFEAIRARPVSRLIKLQRWYQRNTGLALSLGTAAVFLLAGLAVSVVLMRQSARNARRAETALLRYEQMSDAHVIADLISRADALWPRRARRIPDMKAWLSTAKDMLGRRTVHEAEHATLRSRALPYTDADRALDDRRRPELYPALFAEIDRAQQGLRNINRSLDHQVSPRRREELLSEAEEAKQTLADLTENQAVRERITYRFEASQDAWRHRVLTQLVHQLELLPDLVADVEARLAFAQTVKARTVIQEEERWRTCIDDVLSDPRFQGIALSPQVGLIPLGKDADSTLWEFWMPETGAEPGWSGTMLSGKTRVDADSSVVFVLIPGGTFTMGSQRSDPDAPNYDDATVGQEGPAHQVQLTPFLFGKYEITQGVWVRTLGANPAHYFPGREVAFRTTLQCPVENVSWLECRDMLQRHGLILPTEAQWEYAARAGTQTPWWSGPTIEGLDKAGNVADVFMQGFNPSSNYETTLNDGWAVHAPVGTFNPNAFGIHDTIGNILEWCRDPVAHYEVPTLPGDGLRQDDSNRYRDDRVTRGGSYIRPAFYCRSAWRYGISQNSRQSDLGVRPSRTIDP